MPDMKFIRESYQRTETSADPHRSALGNIGAMLIGEGRIWCALLSQCESRARRHLPTLRFGTGTNIALSKVMTRASEPMTRRVVVVPPELPLSDAWTIMERERFRHLPVVRNGRLLGMLSDRDVLLRSELLEDRIESPGIVGEAMTPAPYVCSPTTDVGELVRTMTERKIDAIPVVDDSTLLVGVVTSTDLMLLLITLGEAKVPIPFQFQIEEYDTAASA